MLAKFIRLELFLVLFLLAINGAASLSSVLSEYPDAVVAAHQSGPPDDMKFQKYCDGRDSDQLIEKDDQSCIADYPGEFARGVIASFTLFGFLIGTVICIVYVLFSGRRT